MQFEIQQIQMNSLIKQRTISQILASRKAQRRQKHFNPQPHNHISLNPQTINEVKIQWLLKKSNFNSQDKIMLMRHFEKKYRCYFDHSFNVNLMNWVIVKDKRVLDKQYDSNKKSYFVLRGRVTLSERVVPLRQSQNSLLFSQKSSKYQEIAYFCGESGFGKFFSDEIYHKALIVCENATLLEINHAEDELNSVQRNCLMTTDQKQYFIKQLNLFKNLDSINKYYTPFFTAKRFNKGDYIYQIGQKTQFLYLIVDGQLEFQTKIVIQNEELGENIAISELILKNERENFILVSTETISSFNYFGEEQILAHDQRRQNAKCLSLTCLLLQIPLQKVNKLLFYNQFRQALEISSNDKQVQRLKKIANFMEYRQCQKENYVTVRTQSTVKFDDFNQSIYNHCTERNNKASKKICLRQRKMRILHGNQMKKNEAKSKIKNQSFSMLQVNKKMYQDSLKKYHSFSMEQQRRQKLKTKQQPSKEKQGRSLQQIWRILKLQNILQEQQKLHLNQSEGLKYFNSHMRIVKHLNDIKSYRPKTISSNCRIKTQYIQYLKNAF